MFPGTQWSQTLRQGQKLGIMLRAYTQGLVSNKKGLGLPTANFVTLACLQEAKACKCCPVFSKRRRTCVIRPVGHNSGQKCVL